MSVGGAASVGRQRTLPRHFVLFVSCFWSDRNRQFSLRGQRREVENIRDPVQEVLEVQLAVVKRSVSDLHLRVDGFSERPHHGG